MKNSIDQIYDELLVLRCQAGDKVAMNHLVGRWQPKLIRFAVLITRDPESGREAVQEGWIAIMRGLTRLRDPARYKQWMFRIVHNKCMDLLRAHRVTTTNAQAERPDNSVLNQVEDQEEIAHVLEGLSDDHRIVLALHYLYDLEVQDIAASLGIPPGTVKSRLFNAREAFRQILEDKGGDHEQSRPADRTGLAGRYRFG